MKPTERLNSGRADQARLSTRHGSTAILMASLALLAATTACGRLGSASSGSTDKTITVINNTNASLCRVYVKMASSQTFWGRNRLRSGKRLEPGEWLMIESLKTGYYDLKAKLCEDSKDPGYMHYDLQVGPDITAVWSIGE